MFNFLKEKIKKIYNTFTTKASSLFSRTQIDEDFIKELEVLLISADTGPATTKAIINQLVNDIKSQKIKTVEDIKKALHALLLDILSSTQSIGVNPDPKVLLLMGINGSGKTTFAAKIAKKLKDSGKRVLLVAADTFRAAATNQLNEWALRANVDIFIGKENQDPASVVFDACKKFKDGGYDHLIIDTAGRLQSKVNLMRELEKIKKIIERFVPSDELASWLVIDSMLGQNSFEQAKLFNESTNLNGIVLTKLDGTGKGGIVFAITKELKLPIIYVTFGEGAEDMKAFNPEEYVSSLLAE